MNSPKDMNSPEESPLPARRPPAGQPLVQLRLPSDEAAESEPASVPRSADPLDHAPPRMPAWWGTALLFAGAIILGLATAEGAAGRSLPLPRTWYVNRPLWLLIGVAAVAGGIWLLRPTPGDERDTT